MRYRVFSILLALALCGCRTPQRKFFTDADCPGKATIDEVVRLLALQKQNVQPLRASASCTISWREENSRRNEIVDGPLVFIPPDKILFAGNKLGSKVQFGTNETEFWLFVQEMDTYWWGSKDMGNQCIGTMIVNPANVAEALGVVEVTTDWKLLHRGNYDILDLIEDGKRVKRVYINACDYHIELIEYFDADQMKQVAIELSDYIPGERDGIVVPSRIQVGYFNRQGLDESSVEVRLKHVRRLPPEKQSPKLFIRPSRDGYKEVYQLNQNCEFQLTED